MGLRVYMKTCVFIVVLVMQLHNYQVLYSQKDSDFENFKNLYQLSDEAFRDKVHFLYDSINTIRDVELKNDLLNHLFGITEKKDEIAHIHMLIWKAIMSDTNYGQLFNKAYNLAKKYDRLDDMCLVEYSRGHFYIARKQYDSAMIHILNYRDMTPEDERGEGYRNIINMMGDLYYHAGLYENAKDVYSYMYDMYVEEDNWNFYRPYVMMNNLGQICMKIGKPEKARDWFIKSIATAQNKLNTDYRQNTIAYSKIKLAESEIDIGNIDTAQLLLNEVEEYPDSSLKDDVIQELLFVKANLLMEINEPTKALELANMLIPNDTHMFSSYRFIPEIFKFKSDVYCKMNVYDSAYLYNQKFNIINDSLKNQENLAQSMIILADRDHQLTKSELKDAKQQMKLMVIITVFIVLTLGIVLYFYSKLYQSKLELVKKTLENVNLEQAEKEKVIVSDAKVVLAGPKHNEQQQLIKQLKDLMNSEKLFLDPKTNLNEIAILLKTNRTYLSKAINTQLNTSFPNYLNELRVKEAIGMILSGYAVNHTQDALARHAGFSSRTVFITAFKKHTGVLPSFFIANYKKKGFDIEL